MSSVAVCKTAQSGTLITANCRSFNFNFIKLNQSVYLINLLNIPSVIVELAVNLVTKQKLFMDTHRAQRPLNSFLQRRHTLKIFLVTRKGCWKWDCSQRTAVISATDESLLQVFMPEGKKKKTKSHWNNKSHKENSDFPILQSFLTNHVSTKLYLSTLCLSQIPFTCVTSHHTAASA